jgi:PPP family 3-phenylpropionic acid transporter
VLLQAFFGAPVNPLADNAILEQLGPDGRHNYGRARLWGAVGYGGAAYGAGALIAPFGMTLLGPLYAVIQVITAWVAAHLPAPRTASAPQFHNLKALLRDARWRGLLAAMFLTGLCAAIHGNFFLLYLHSLGASPQLFGGAVVLASLSEMVIFFLSPRMVQRGHARTMVIAGMLAWALREILCALIPDPLLVTITQLLHGLAFSMMWTGAITLTRVRVPLEWGATAQAILTSVTFGAAWGLGALLGGQLLERSGAIAMFAVAAGCAITGLALFLITQRGDAAEGLAAA